MGLLANNSPAITRLGPYPGRRANNFLLFLQLTAMVSSHHKSDPRLTSAKGGRGIITEECQMARMRKLPEVDQFLPNPGLALLVNSRSRDPAG